MTETRTKTYGNHIGGEWVEAASGETFEDRNPANGELIATYARSGKDDVDRAVEAARGRSSGGGCFRRRSAGRYFTGSPGSWRSARRTSPAP